MANGQIRFANILTLKLGTGGIGYYIVPEKSIPELVHYTLLIKDALSKRKSLSPELMLNLESLIDSLTPDNIILDDEYQLRVSIDVLDKIKTVYPLVKVIKINGDATLRLDQHDIKAIFKQFFEGANTILSKYQDHTKSLGGGN